MRPGPERSPAFAGELPEIAPGESPDVATLEQDFAGGRTDESEDHSEQG